MENKMTFRETVEVWGMLTVCLACYYALKVYQKLGGEV